MKSARMLASLTFAIAMAFGPVSGWAATFTYHGNLQDSGRPAEGNYDLELTLYSAANGGSAIAGPLLLYNVPAHGGAFSVEADFGPLSNITEPAWLGVKLRSAGQASYAELSARSPVSADATASVCPGAWTLFGNAGTSPGNYLGTADNQPLVIAVNGVQAARIASSSDGAHPDSTNVVLGSSGNFVGPGIGGATVSGGGSAAFANCGPAANQLCVNAATGAFSTVAGGYANRTIGDTSAIGGGALNAAYNDYATVSGGIGNTADGSRSSVAGGTANQANALHSTVSGGSTNTAGGPGSTVAGGVANTAAGAYSVAVAGNGNAAGGDNSLAAGYSAHVRNAAEVGNAFGDSGTFIWSDTSAGNFTSTGARQFLVRAIGGVGINTAAPLPHTLTVAGSSGPITGFTPQSSTTAVFENNAIAFIELATPAANENGVLFSLVGKPADGGIVYNNGGTLRGLQLRTGGNVVQVAIDSAGNTFNHSGAWSMLSDRRLKRDFAPIDNPLDTFLGLQGATFEYIDPAQSLATPGRRMGFVAQDVEQVLPQWVSEDARGYKMVTPQGFEALTVEAVRTLRDEKDTEIAQLRSENAALRDQLGGVLTRLNRLEARTGE
jgi:hypothetical protein